MEKGLETKQMKLTKKILERIIREELQAAMQEADGYPHRDPFIGKRTPEQKDIMKKTAMNPRNPTKDRFKAAQAAKGSEKNEEELGEGLKDLAFGGALAAAGLAGANKAYDTFNPKEVPEYPEGPKDTRTKIQKSRSAINQHRQAAEDAAARGDFKEAERQLIKLHKQLEAVELDAAFATGGFDAAGEVDYDLLGNIQKDLGELQADYKRMQRIKE